MLHEAKTRASRRARGAGDADGGRDVDRWRLLMLAARDGDDAAYDALLREVSGWLHRYFRRRLAPGVAEDASQEVLVALHVRRYTYVDSGPFGPWLAAIARHKWMDCLRQRSRDPLPLMDHDFPIDDHGRAVRAAIALDDLMADLKPAQARVIRLVKLEGRSVQEAAEATGQSPSLVKVNIHRGLKRVARTAGEAEAA